jgi:hypothetical protein
MMAVVIFECRSFFEYKLFQTIRMHKRRKLYIKGGRPSADDVQYLPAHLSLDIISKINIMRKLIVFNHVSLDGYFTGENGDFRWAHEESDDPEYAAFVAGNAGGGGQLLFGRITYDLMAGYWTTKSADQHDPIVAKAMNNMQKVVF